VSRLRKVVAVEEGLTPITLLLKREGYDVVDLEGERWKTADAIVVSGMDSNLMDIQETETRVNVVEAAGKTPEEVLKDIKSRAR
jgi:hypothetical protein